MRISIKKIIEPAISILIAELAGAIGTIFTAHSIATWYATLTKPAFNPPSWVFGPVWTTLYALMGIASYLVWKKREGAQAKKALYVYSLQLVLNMIWSIIFFGMHNPGLALADIVLLWLAILCTMRAFSKVSRASAWILLPYILWVSFAAYLNCAIWILN